jgi:hypothetical protein
MGLLKIDNTVVPSQVYVNGKALAPGSGVEDVSDKFEITPLILMTINIP